jgi:hypothetical protein
MLRWDGEGGDSKPPHRPRQAAPRTEGTRFAVCASGRLLPDLLRAVIDERSPAGPETPIV